MIHERPNHPDQADTKREHKARSPALPHENQPEGLKREEPTEQKRANCGRETDALGDPFGEVLDDMGKDEGQTDERNRNRPGPEALRRHQRSADIQTG